MPNDFITHGRKVGAKREHNDASSRDFEPKDVRQWAEANGIDVNSRGRIPAEIVERYRSAGN